MAKAVRQDKSVLEVQKKKKKQGIKSREGVQCLWPREWEIGIMVSVHANTE